MNPSMMTDGLHKNRTRVHVPSSLARALRPGVRHSSSTSLLSRVSKVGPVWISSVCPR
jgi:hypothetical protein